MQQPKPGSGDVGRRPYYSRFLDEELERRRKKNPKYSLRAFARLLEIDSSALSRIMSGSQLPSLKACQLMLQKLAVAKEVARLFLSSVAEEKGRRATTKLGSEMAISEMREPPVSVPADVFATFADVYSLAVLEMPFLEKYEPNPCWIAAQLGISEAKAAESLELLIKLGLLRREGDRLVKPHRNVTTPEGDHGNKGLKALQNQALEIARDGLNRYPFGQRSHRVMVLAADPDKIAEAQEMIREFIDNLCDFLESGRPRRIYQMGFQLVPLQIEPEANEVT